jgi:hypothetical protein
MPWRPRLVSEKRIISHDDAQCNRHHADDSECSRHSVWHRHRKRSREEKIDDTLNVITQPTSVTMSGTPQTQTLCPRTTIKPNGK